MDDAGQLSFQLASDGLPREPPPSRAHLEKPGGSGLDLCPLSTTFFSKEAFRIL